MMPPECMWATRGMAAAGTGTPGLELIPSFLPMESSIARSAGVFTRLHLSSGIRSLARGSTALLASRRVLILAFRVWSMDFVRRQLVPCPVPVRILRRGPAARVYPAEAFMAQEVFMAELALTAVQVPMAQARDTNLS